MIIRPAGATATPAAAGSARRSAAGFSVPEGASQAVASQEAQATGAVSLDVLLALQEVEPALERDRRARRHGLQMLGQLGRLQQALLEDEATAASARADALSQLESLSRSIPVAADPVLRAAMAEVAVRAAVERARYEMPMRASNVNRDIMLP